MFKVQSCGPKDAFKDIGVSAPMNNLTQNMPLTLNPYNNSVVLVRKRTIPIERPQPAGEVSANFS
jgi:hypothetical protein